jgi:hypothetical protein
LVSVWIESELEGFSKSGYSDFIHDTSFSRRTFLVRGRGSLQRISTPHNLTQNRTMSRKRSDNSSVA